MSETKSGTQNLLGNNYTDNVQAQIRIYNEK